MLRERQTLRRRLFEILESAVPGDTTRQVFDVLMCVLIVSNVLAATVETIRVEWPRGEAEECCAQCKTAQD